MPRTRTQIRQRHLREIQNTCWQVKAAEFRSYADQGDMYRFYAGTKEIFGPICSSTSKLQTTKNSPQKKRSSEWQLSHRIKKKILRKTSQWPVKLRMAFSPSINDFMTTLKLMKPGWPPSPCSMPPNLEYMAWDAKYLILRIKCTWVSPLKSKAQNSVFENYHCYLPALHCP